MTVPQPIYIYSKDPAAVLDYTLDWADYLDDDSIVSVVWTLDGGITNSGSLFSRSLTTIFLSGGTAGNGYNISCQITTAGGRTDVRTFKINAVSR